MKKLLANKRGEGYINTAVIIIIAVVIGGLLLGGLYLLFASDGGILDNLNSEVEGMMDYEQELRYERYYNEEKDKYILQYSYDGRHWNKPEMPEYNETATVYATISNNSDANPIDAALIQDGTTYYVITSNDGGITWTEQVTFTATAITHCYFGTSDPLPAVSGTFSGEKFVVRYKNGPHYTMVSDGITWRKPSMSDLVELTPLN